MRSGKWISRRREERGLGVKPTAVYPRVARANNSMEGEQLGISSWGRRLLTCVPIRWTLGLLGRVDRGGCPPRRRVRR